MKKEGRVLIAVCLNEQQRIWWMYGNCFACGSHVEQIVLTMPHEVREDFLCTNKACGKRYSLDEEGKIHERRN